MDIVELKLSIEAMIQFGIIINELITNSIKHAFEGKEGNISIILQKHEKHYVLTYKDDGRGMQSEQKGFGQNLISISAKQLDASVQITNHDGLKYEFNFTKENT